MPESDSEDNNSVCKLIQPKDGYSIYGSLISVVSELTIAIK